MAFNHQAYNAIYLEDAQKGDAATNDAAKKYGVRIEPADVAPGEKYWRVIGVHHLKPMENWGNHHVYLDVLNADGNRMRQPIAWVGFTWEGRHPDEAAPPVPVDKPDAEPGSNIAIGKSQSLTVWVKGRKQSATDKSDRVTGIRTAHPDEPLPDGTLHNTWGHHSFYVVFQETVKTDSAPHPAHSTISGRLIGGEGEKVRLTQGNAPVAAATVGADETFSFENLAAGVYSVAVQGTNIRRTNLAVDGENHIEINLAMPVPEASIIRGTVKNSHGETVILSKGDVVITRQTLPPDGTFAFTDLPAGVYTVSIWETDIRQPNIAVDGRNTRTVNLEIPTEPPAAEKSIAHFVLLPPPQTRARRLVYFAAMDFVLHFSLALGFDPDTAKLAKRVTAIGDSIATDTLAAVRQSGAQVEHLVGTVAELESLLAERIRTDTAFGG